MLAMPGRADGGENGVVKMECVGVGGGASRISPDPFFLVEPFQGYNYED
jgi:hypothetical protein